MTFNYNLDFINDKRQKSLIKKAVGLLQKKYYSNVDFIGWFLDPYQQNIITKIAADNDINIYLNDAGNEYTERKIFTSKITDSIYEVITFANQDFKHPEILGSILALGVLREDIGDIVIGENIEVSLLGDCANLVRYDLYKVGRKSVEVKFKKDKLLNINKPRYLEKTTFISSLRIDNLISAFTGLSRTKVKQIIKKKDVKVNHLISDKVSTVVEKGSLISIKHYGRFIFDDVLTVTRKDNLKISYRKVI